MMFPLVRDLAAEGIPVAVTCEVLGFSRQAFYKWQHQPMSDRDWDDAHLVNAIVDAHRDDPEFGYRFLADELERGGHRASENRVHRCVVSIGSGRPRPARAEKAPASGPARQFMMISSSVTSPPTAWTRCG